MDKADIAKIKQESSIPKNAKILLFLGHLIEKKGVEYLIEAFPAVLRSHPDTYLFIGGYGPRESTLKELVKKYWLEADIVNGIYISDAAYQIEIIFDWLNKEKKIDAKTCYHDFVRYKKAQSHLFTDTVKKLILKTAHAIAASFSGLNKSELIMLAKLDLEFKKTGL